MTPQRILLVRSLPLDRDSRSTRMVDEYRRRGHRVTALVWSRGDPVLDRADTIVCKTAGGYGQRLRGLSARLKWLAFMLSQLIVRRNEYDVVHVVDFDTAIIGLPIGRILNKIVVYDAFDHIGAIMGGGTLAQVLATLERWWVGAAAIAIFPDAIRLEQYGVPATPRIVLIGNIPDAPPDLPAPADGHDHPLRLVYVGTLEAGHRGLEYIPTACEALGERIEFVVGGTGQLHEFFLQQAARIPNLTYRGHLDYPGALREMAAADVLYGPYLLTAPAHRYASPNKMYEHLALGRPLLTNCGTPPGRLVERAESGFLFDGSCEGLVQLLGALDGKTCRAVGTKARQVWDSEFSNLRQTQLERFFSRLRSVGNDRYRFGKEACRAED